MLFFAVLPGIPRPKGNSRQVWRQGKRIRFQADAKYLAWVEQVAPWVFRAKVESGLKVPIAVPVELSAVFYRDRRPDTDNLIKGLLDLLAKYCVLKNDRLVRRISAEVRSCPLEQPRVEVEIRALEMIRLGVQR